MIEDDKFGIDKLTPTKLQTLLESKNGRKLNVDMVIIALPNCYPFC